MSTTFGRLSTVRFNRPTALLAFGLLVIALAGVLALKQATPYGMGLVNDSSAYIGGAEGILAGDGFYRVSGGGELKPITHFPPLYSLALAVFGLSGVDLLLAARVLNLGLFGLVIILSGLLAFRITRSLVWALMAALLVSASGALLRVFSFALSEPLFLLLMLSVFWLLAAAVERKHWFFYILTGFAFSLAYLTRYAALAVLAAALVVLVMALPGWRERIRAVALLLAGAAPLVLTWTIRNIFAAEEAANRATAWHPVSLAQLHTGMQHLARWAFPGMSPLFSGSAGLFSILGWLVLFGLVVVIITLSRRRPINGCKALALGLAVFVPLYVLFLAASISLFDASTPLDNRILSPAVLALIFLASAGAGWLWNWGTPAPRVLAVVLSLALVLSSLVNARLTVQNLERDGQGFASLSWVNSQALVAVRDLPSDLLLYSNRPTAIHLTTDRAAYILPSPIDPATAQPRTNYHSELASMREDVFAGRAVVIIFDYTELMEGEDRPWLEELTRDMKIRAEYNEAVIFGAP